MVNTLLNFATKCRSCFAEDQEMHHLFREFDQGLNLSDILKSTTYLDIEENDGLSPYLCANCTTVVVDFFNFKSVYLENDNYIKSLCKEKNVDQCHNEDSETNNIVESSISRHEKLNSTDIIHTNLKEVKLEDITDIEGEYIEPKVILKGEGSKNCLSVNLESKDEDIILQCDMCNDKFNTYSEIIEHWKYHKKYVCEHCGAGFLKKSYLNDHAEIHTTEKRHVCPICGKAFRRRTVLVKHKKIHTHPRQCVCEICGLRFTDKGTLTTHIKLKHTKERNFNCMICGLWFPLKSTLLKHISRHNEDRKREHVCEICHIAYKDKSSLNRHVLIKHTENATKPSCSICRRQYTTNTNLLKHIRKHHQSIQCQGPGDEKEGDSC